MTAAAIKVVDLGVAYGGRSVLSGLTFEVGPGEVWAVLGSNGAGKSSLVRALTGLVPHMGTLSIGGIDDAAMSPEVRARMLGWVPQELPDDVQFSALEVVLMGRLAQSWRGPDEAQVKAAMAALEQVALGPVASTPVNQLSGGERRRVWLARAFFGGQKLLVLDEPTAFLDVVQQRGLLKSVRSAATRGLSAVTVVHDLSLVQGLATHALMLKEGRCVAQGPADAVLNANNLSATFGAPIREVAPGIFLPE